MTVPDPLDNVAVVAARALLAVTEILDDVADSCDERFLESLLLNALNHIPDLGPQLLGCPPTARFCAGQPRVRREADIVAWDGDIAVAQLEVKTRAAVNGGPGWNQFDQYAAAAAPGTGLFVVTATRKQASLLAHSVDWSRWMILLPARVHEVTKAVIGPLPDGGGSVEQLVRSLARISHPDGTQPFTGTQ
jgi:hypothetical protein